MKENYFDYLSLFVYLNLTSLLRVGMLSKDSNIASVFFCVEWP